MSNDEAAAYPAVEFAQLARPFARLGWIGFWLQVALATLPIVLLLYVVLRSPPVSGSGRGVDIREYVAFGSLLVLLFTIAWCYRYTRIAERMLTPATRPTAASVVRTLWIGVSACCLGAFISIALLLTAVVRLLVVFMLAPQGGVPVMQTAPSDRAWWVSALDMVDLLTMVLTLTAELVVLSLSLYLLYRMLRHAAGYDRAAAAIP
ncbi:MAG: DUF3611 family protein [Deltaproteobacteria bacterium]|nr:DUF3611 family protein [Deltaproteobacteria bacterium]